MIMKQSRRTQMSEEKKYKWTKIGQMQTSKYKNDDGSDRFLIKIDKTITLREGEILNMFVPKNENAPEFVVYDISRKNTNIV